jgi:hypothetical protein
VYLQRNYMLRTSYLQRKYGLLLFTKSSNILGNIFNIFRQNVIRRNVIRRKIIRPKSHSTKSYSTKNFSPFDQKFIRRKIIRRMAPNSISMYVNLIGSFRLKHIMLLHDLLANELSRFLHVFMRAMNDGLKLFIYLNIEHYM